jgi:hypothetical protein
MAVPIELGEEIILGTPTFLFEGTFHAPLVLAKSFDVTADGERFVVVESNTSSPGELHVVLNWHKELERLVPN